MTDLCPSPRQVFVPEGTAFAAVQIAGYCAQNGLPLPFQLPGDFQAGGAGGGNSAAFHSLAQKNNNKLQIADALAASPTTPHRPPFGDRSRTAPDLIQPQPQQSPTAYKPAFGKTAVAGRQSQRLVSDSSTASISSSSEGGTESTGGAAAASATQKPTTALGWAEKRLVPFTRRTRDPVARARENSIRSQEEQKAVATAAAAAANRPLLRLGPILDQGENEYGPRYGAFGDEPIATTLATLRNESSIGSLAIEGIGSESSNYTTSAVGHSTAMTTSGGGGSGTGGSNGYSHVGQASNISAGPLFDGTGNVTIPVGTESQISGISIYSAGHRTDPSAVIVLPDLFGWRNVNTRLICDKIAEAGFLVIMPDLFDGDTLDFSSPGASAAFPDWCKRHNKNVVAPICAKILDYIEENVRPRLGTAAVGYCFGGRYSVIANAAGRVRCSVVSCPSFLEPEEWSAMQTPSLWLCAENDRTFLAEERIAAQRALSDKYYESIFCVFPQTEHGFTTRYHPGKRGAAAASKDALIRTIEFLRDTLYE